MKIIWSARVKRVAAAVAVGGTIAGCAAVAVVTLTGEQPRDVYPGSTSASFGTEHQPGGHVIER